MCRTEINATDMVTGDRLCAERHVYQPYSDNIQSVPFLYTHSWNKGFIAKILSNETVYETIFMFADGVSWVVVWERLLLCHHL